MANGGYGMSGSNYDAFVSSQRTFSDHDLAAKLQEQYWRARQKFLSKIEKKEDACIILSDSKLDSKLEIYRSIDRSCAKLTNILESYQNYLYVLANEENSLGILLRECGKIDKTKAGKIMAFAGKSLTQSSHQRIRLYMPLVRLHQEMETFYSQAVHDTSGTVDKLESRRSQYRASLLWMKDISERLNPDVYRQLDKFRRVQNQVRSDKKAFDCIKMDVVQKIDLLMASRCNLMNQILAPYQAILLETFEKNYENFENAESSMKKEDIYDYEFKTLKELNPLQLSDENDNPESSSIDEGRDVLQENNNGLKNDLSELKEEGFLVDVSADTGGSDDIGENKSRSNSTDLVEQLKDLFDDGQAQIENGSNQLIDVDLSKPELRQRKFANSNLSHELLNMDAQQQLANLLGPSEREGEITMGAGISSSSGSSLFGLKLNNLQHDDKQNAHNPALFAKSVENILEEDLMGGDMLLTRDSLNNSTNVDLLTNELEDIDNSSYFRSLQNHLQL